MDRCPISDKVFDFDRVVEKVRSLTCNVTSEKQERTYTTKHGTVATMKTGNIGKAIAKSENQNQLAEIVSVDECCKCNNSGEKTVACATNVVL